MNEIKNSHSFEKCENWVICDDNKWLLWDFHLWMIFVTFAPRLWPKLQKRTLLCLQWPEEGERQIWYQIKVSQNISISVKVCKFLSISLVPSQFVFRWIEKTLCCTRYIELSSFQDNEGEFFVLNNQSLADKSLPETKNFKFSTLIYGKPYSQDLWKRVGFTSRMFTFGIF